MAAGRNSFADDRHATEPADRVLVIRRVLDAPRSVVFKVWTEPAHLMRWWGPEGYTVLSCEADVRPGGSYRIHSRSPEHTEHRVTGVYREVVAPERLVFTFAWLDEAGKPKLETLVSVTFAERGGQTELTLRQSLFESVTARDLHDAGWSSTFDVLERYLARL